MRAAAESQISLLTGAWSAIAPVSSKTTASAPARVALDAPHALDATALTPPFGLFDRYLKPHPHSPFPERGNPWADRIAARADFPIYFIDDETAIRVSGDQTDIVSEGQWRSHQCMPGPRHVSRAPVPGWLVWAAGPDVVGYLAAVRLRGHDYQVAGQD